MRAWGLRDALPCRLVTVSAKEAISKKKGPVVTGSRWKKRWLYDYYWHSE